MAQFVEAWEITQDIETLNKRYGCHRFGTIRNEYIWDINLKLGRMSKNGNMFRMLKSGELSYNRISGIVSFSFNGMSPTKDNVFVGDSRQPFTLSHYDMKIIHEMLVRAKRSERNWLATAAQGFRKESTKGVTFAV